MLGLACNLKRILSSDLWALLNSKPVVSKVGALPPTLHTRYMLTPFLVPKEKGQGLTPYFRFQLGKWCTPRVSKEAFPLGRTALFHTQTKDLTEGLKEILRIPHTGKTNRKDNCNCLPQTPLDNCKEMSYPN